MGCRINFGSSKNKVKVKQESSPVFAFQEGDWMHMVQTFKHALQEGIHIVLVVLICVGALIGFAAIALFLFIAELAGQFTEGIDR